MTSRQALKALLDPASPRFVEGSEEDRQRARDEWHRQRYTGQVMSSSLPEIPRSSLTFLPFGVIEHEDGRLFRARRDGLIDLEYVPGAVAYYCDDTGLPVLLEEPAGAKTRTELDREQAARKARRAAPPPKPSWTR